MESEIQSIRICTSVDAIKFEELIERERWSTKNHQYLDARLMTETVAYKIDYDGHYGANIFWHIDTLDFNAENVLKVQNLIKEIVGE